MKLTVLFTVGILMSAYESQAQQQYKFVCYFPNWAFYRTGVGKYTVSNVNPNLCTHLIYAFAVLDATTYTIKVFDSWVDIDNQFYAKFNALRQTNPALKTLIAIGGWSDSQGTKYSQLVADSTRINTFVTSVVNFLKQYGFNGLDVDWEYPATAADKTGFVNLLRALRTALTQNGYLLSVAVSAGQSTIDAGYDIPGINQNVDFINLMTYDLHGAWETTSADHHAPLHKRSWDTTNLYANFSVNYWISKGATPSKLILGIPIYGRSWKLSSTKVTPPAPASGAGDAGPFTNEKGYLAYYEVCNNVKINGWRVTTDPNLLMGPYAYSSTDWVGYDNAAMAQVKVRYAISRGLGGAMVWDISMDDFTNLCGAGANPMQTAISTALTGSSTTTTTTSSPTSTSATTLSTTIAATTTTAAPTTTTIRSTTTTTQPTTTFTCPSTPGYYPNPTSCSSYYICSQPPLMQCSTGLYFNPLSRTCDYPQNVNCTAGP